MITAVPEGAIVTEFGFPSGATAGSAPAFTR